MATERRVVTVLFVDLVGYTGLAEQLDPEDVSRLLTPYYGSVRAELERFGGTVEKFIGDAILGVFGAPLAHEDDAERALRAAFAARRVVEEMNEPGTRLRPRSARRHHDRRGAPRPRRRSGARRDRGRR